MFCFRVFFSYFWPDYLPSSAQSFATSEVSYDLSSILTANGISKIVIQGIFLCLVGSIESLMTAEVVESFTKEPGDGNRTVLAMGGANLLSGFLGGMGGNAMSLAGV
jgi:SulP family sulfate permease